MLSDQLFGVLIRFGKQFRHFYKQGKKAFLTSGLALHGRMEALQNKKYKRLLLSKTLGVRCAISNDFIL